jgi:(2Fe-2S) ferredoxin
VQYYQKHLFFCANQRTNGKKCCQEQDALGMQAYVKAALQAKELHKAGLCRATTSSCLGRCEKGPCLVIYPEGVWYTYQNTDDLDEIIEEHLINGKLVDRLIIPIEA